MKKARVGRAICLLVFLGVSIFLLVTADHCFMENAYPRKDADLVETASKESEIPQDLLYACLLYTSAPAQSLSVPGLRRLKRLQVPGTLRNQWKPIG